MTTRKVTRFDRATAREVGKRITEALATLADELGVSIEYKGGSFSERSLVCKLEVACKGDSGEVFSRTADDFKRSAWAFGLKPEDLGRTFKAQGRVFTITGLRSKATKRPILATADGRSFAFPAEDVIRLMGGGK